MDEMLNEDDEFLKAAQEIENRENEKESSKGDPELMELYKSLTFCCLSDTKEFKYRIFRMLGHTPKPIERVDQNFYTDSIICHQVEVMGDNKKPVKFIIPERDQTDADKDHLLYRIYDKVCEFDWVDKKRVFRWKEIYKDLFAWASNGGFTGNKGKFGRGLYPSVLLIQNVIDRADMAWHRENKKTKILAKGSFDMKVKDENGNEVDAIGYNVGLPYNSVSNIWKDLWTKYGNWENYDVAIRPAKKVGDNTIALSMVNASRLKEKDMFDDIGEDLAKYIVQGPLTDEERSWERFNIGKAYSVSSYSKINSRIGKRLAAIDEAFGTKYAQECKDLASDEAKLRKAAKEKDQFTEEEEPVEADHTAVSVPREVPKEEPKPAAETAASPARRRSLLDESKPATAESPIDTSLLKGWSLLSAEQKAEIESTNKDKETGKLLNIKFKASAGTLVPCAVPTCNCPFPETWLVCPACGARFESDPE